MSLAIKNSSILNFIVESDGSWYILILVMWKIWKVYDISGWPFVLTRPLASILHCSLCFWTWPQVNCYWCIRCMNTTSHQLQTEVFSKHTSTSYQQFFTSAQHVSEHSRPPPFKSHQLRLVKADWQWQKWNIGAGNVLINVKQDL